MMGPVFGTISLDMTPGKVPAQLFHFCAFSNSFTKDAENLAFHAYSAVANIRD